MASGKTDMERIGLFSEGGYITIGDRYPKHHVDYVPFHESAHKDRQMLPGGNKMRSATQAGYFEKEFKRIMEREAYSNLAIMRRRDRILAKQKNLSSEFIPSSYTKLPSGLGSYYGTFSGVVTAFSPLIKPGPPYEPPGKNFYTNPGKKGTGYGYSNVLIGKPYEHSDDLYDRGRFAQMEALLKHKQTMKGGPFKLNMYPQHYFEKNPYITDREFKDLEEKRTSKEFISPSPFKPSSPGKKLGGCKAGTFEIYPTHSTDPYHIVKLREPIRNKDGQIFRPNAGLKSCPVSSIITTNVMRTLSMLEPTLSILLVWYVSWKSQLSTKAIKKREKGH